VSINSTGPVVINIENSGSSASSAASAQTAAETARDQTLTAYDNFDDRYLGAKTSDPTVDNDGNALIAGSLYFNSSAQAMRVYTGSVWVDAYSSGTTFLAKANNLSDLPSTSTARTNLGLGTAATTDATAYATAAQGTNADTAYGWGDHATEGYAIYPTQTGNSGKFLSTNGSSASWETVNVTPALDDLSDVAITTPSTDQVLKYNGSGWVNGAAPAGTVLQVVSANYGTNTSTTSTTYVTTGLTASITPKFSTSKIMVFCNLAVDMQSAPSQGYFTIYRNTTSILTNDKGFEAYSPSQRTMTSGSLQYLDSPATTSSTSYSVYFRTTSGSYTLAINPDSTNSVITLMEIAA
jgi:hypothetical protein